MRNAIATMEGVTKAVDTLLSAGQQPTVEAVRSTMGGGSYSTINKLLADELARRKAEAVKIADVPPEIARLGTELGAKIAADIFSRVGQSANARVAQIEMEAGEKLAASEAARAEASREIGRLEADLERAAAELSEACQVAAQANARAAAAEGRVEQQSVELARQTAALEAAQSAERHAIAEAAEMRGQVLTLERLLKLRPHTHQPTERAEEESGLTAPTS